MRNFNIKMPYYELLEYRNYRLVRKGVKSYSLNVDCIVPDFNINLLTTSLHGTWASACWLTTSHGSFQASAGLH